MNLKPTDAIALFQIIGRLNWRELNRADYDAFADAGPDARIADITGTDQAEICELLDFRAHHEFGLLAIIGGDGLQIELHGCTADAEPIDWCLPIAPFGA